MKILLIAALLFCSGCATYPVYQTETKLRSGLEVTEYHTYEGTSYSLAACYQKALKPLAVFPEANVSFSGTSELVKDLENNKSREMASSAYLKVRNKEKYEQKILQLAEKYNQGRRLTELNAHDALVLISQIIRGQLSSETVDSAVWTDMVRLYQELDNRKGFHFSVFSVMSIDEYFLGGYKKAEYRCGMVSWNAVYIFDFLQKRIPALNNICIFECGTCGPAHSFNLLLSLDGNRVGMYLVDFQKEKFWQRRLEVISTPEKMLYRLDMSDIGIDRLGR